MTDRFENLEVQQKAIIMSEVFHFTQFPAHWHSYGEIIINRGMSNAYVINGNIYHLVSNDVLLVWPNELHSTENADPSTYYIIQFESTLLNQLHDLRSASNNIKLHHHYNFEKYPQYYGSIVGPLDRIRSLSATSDDFSETRCCIELYKFFINIFSFFSTISPAHSVPNNISENQKLLLLLCDHIKGNLADDNSLLTVSSKIGMSASYFSRYFKDTMGLGYNEWINAQRVNYSIKLMADNDRKLTDIAFSAGFGSISAFNRSFKKVKGCTPGEFRTLQQLSR